MRGRGNIYSILHFGKAICKSFTLAAVTRLRQDE